MEGEDLSRFAWQYYSRFKWNTYADEDIKTLNSAIKKKQKTVTLKGKYPKLIDFDNLHYQNKETLFRNKIRPLIYNSGFFSWMYMEDGNFFSYKADILFLLEVAYERKEILFKYYDNGDFEINLETFQERNEKTCEIKSITREEVNFPSLTSELFNISLDSSAFRRMYEMAPLNFQTRYMILPASSNISRMLERETIDIKPLSKIDVTDSMNIKVTVDHLCPNNQDFQVFSENDIYYSATLSLVKLQKNENKFYFLQLLQHHKKGYKIYIRSGRVGTNGEIQLKTFINLENAKKEFEKKFYEKTKNVFTEKVFNHIVGQYNLLKVDWNSKLKKVPGTMQFHISLQSILEMICNEDTFNAVLKEMYYDSSCVPLGDLTITQIKYGYSILSKIVSLVCASSGSSGIDLVDACNEFYSAIPHNFGKKHPPLIQTEKDIEDKMKMLESLLNIRIALKAMSEEVTSPATLVHPLTHFYQKLRYSLELVDPASAEYIAIEKSMKETCGPTHTSYDLEILNIFACCDKREDKINEDCEKLLLWHGSRITNWAGILKEGLQIAPPEAPSTGFMFGKGIYFADICTKSANYCFPTKEMNEGLLLMCEVAVGNMLPLLEADKELPHTLPSEFDSVFAKGKFSPSNFKSGILSHEAKAPFGPIVHRIEIETSLLYNEYITYDTKKVQIKYLLRLQFNFK